MYQEIGRIQLHNYLYAAAWSRDSHFVAVLAGDNLQVYAYPALSQVYTNQVVDRPPQGHSLEFLSQDSLIVGGGRGTSVTSIHALTEWKLGQETPKGFFPSSEPREAQSNTMRQQDTFAISPDKRLLLSVDNIGTSIYAYSIHDHQLAMKIRTPIDKEKRTTDQHGADSGLQQDWITAISYSKDPNRAALCSGLGNLYLLNTISFEFQSSNRVFPAGVRCTSVAFSTDDRFIAVGREGPHAVLVQEADKTKATIEADKDSKGVYIVSNSSQQILAGLGPFSGSVRDIKWSSNNTLIVSDDHSLHVYILTDGRIVQSEQRFNTPTSAISISDAGIIAAAQGSELAFYAPQTGK